MRRVVWSNAAIDTLDQIADYVESFDPAAARRLATRLIEVAASLAQFPERGRLIGGETRQMSLVHPYLIQYLVSGGDVLILRVRHGARQKD